MLEVPCERCRVRGAVLEVPCETHVPSERCRVRGAV